MEREARERFNRAFTPDLYQSYISEVERRVGFLPPFRLAETPLFLPHSLLERLIRAGDDLIEQASRPELIEELDREVPDRFQAPGRDAIPGMVTIDFALVDVDGEVEPRLIELQGFPSLYAFEVLQRDAWNAVLNSIDGLDREWLAWPPEWGREGFLEYARQTILGDHRPEDVVLLEIDPEGQKTRADFAATKTLFGVDTVDVATLERRGHELWATSNGEARRIHRIYNRVISDELIATGTDLPVDFHEELDVEWVCHPDWYYIWSKATLPFFDHWSVPEIKLVSELDEIPADLSEEWVLKPLFSFAGGGVQIEPQRRHIETIPEGEAHLWCLQKKVVYAPVVRTPEGVGVKAEVRMMYLRPEPDGPLVFAENLVRLSRGKMIGVDYNRDFTWVGSTIALW